jgi:cold shock protein
MALGTVTWFSIEKGFGLIAPMDGSTDVFVDADAVARAGLRLLLEGQRVRYEVATNGPRQVAEHLSLA